MFLRLADSRPEEEAGPSHQAFGAVHLISYSIVYFLGGMPCPPLPRADASMCAYRAGPRYRGGRMYVYSQTPLSHCPSQGSVLDNAGIQRLGYTVESNINFIMEEMAMIR